MDSLTVSSALINATSNTRLTPAMVTVLWVIADKIDRMKLKENPPNGVWLKVPSAKLRGTEARNDNIWLRKCLDRLSEIRIGGEYRGDPWGAVMVSEWHIREGGSVTEILVPPAAVQTLRAPETFVKIETHAAYKLQGSSRRLYGALADKKRLDQDFWIFPLDELRSLLGVADKKAYKRWNNFKFRVLDPAIKEINDFGTVRVTMTPQKTGRAIDAVKFTWKWKTIDEVRVTDEENARHDSARHKASDGSAPPLTLPPIAQNMKAQLEPHHWENWLAGCSFLDTVDGGIQIVAPSTFIAQHIKDNFQTQIINAREACKIEGAVKVVHKE